MGREESGGEDSRRRPSVCLVTASRRGRTTQQAWTMFSLGCFMLTFRHRHRNTALHSPVIAELPVERRAAVSVRGTAHSVLVDDRRRERARCWS